MSNLKCQTDLVSARFYLMVKFFSETHVVQSDLLVETLDLLDEPFLLFSLTD